MIEKKAKRKTGSRVSRMRISSKTNAHRSNPRARASFRGLRATFADVSLQDMIAASRIVAAYEDGFVAEVKSGSDKAKSIAARVIIPKPTGRTVIGISSHQLNRAIIQRNEKENKPTPKAVSIYKKMMSEE